MQPHFWAILAPEGDSQIHENRPLRFQLSSDQERRVVRQVSDDIGNIGGTIVQEKSAKAIFGIKWLTLTQ